jgi:hypothetical protein
LLNWGRRREKDDGKDRDQNLGRSIVVERSGRLRSPTRSDEKVTDGEGEQTARSPRDRLDRKTRKPSLLGRTNNGHELLNKGGSCPMAASLL